MSNLDRCYPGSSPSTSGATVDLMQMLHIINSKYAGLKLSGVNNDHISDIHFAEDWDSTAIKLNFVFVVEGKEKIITVCTPESFRVNADFFFDQIDEVVRSIINKYKESKNKHLK